MKCPDISIMSITANPLDYYAPHPFFYCTSPFFPFPPSFSQPFFEFCEGVFFFFGGGGGLSHSHTKYTPGKSLFVCVLQLLLRIRNPLTMLPLLYLRMVCFKVKRRIESWFAVCFWSDH